MTPVQKRQLEQSEVREKINGLLALDSLSDEQRGDLAGLTERAQQIEVELRAAIVAESADAEQRARQFEGAAPDGEARERAELRAKATVTGFLRAALSGKEPGGAEAEYRAAEGCDGIPMALFDPPPERRADTATGAPGTVGVNLQPILPALFATSIAPRLGIDMPRAPSGTYASATITTSLTAAARDKGVAAEASAAAFTVSTATPKRISARLQIRVEDVAAAGQANFESSLRSNLGMALSAELDDQAVNGNGTAPNIAGILGQLTDPADPTNVSTFDDFVAAFAGGIDGLWALTPKDVGMVAGVDTYKLSARTFRDATGQDLGDMAFSDYAMQHYGGWWTNSRMPAPASTIQPAILRRMGRSGVRTAVCPHWGEIGIDDIYSGSASGTRFVTFHALIGDIIVTQPAAYSRVDFKVS